MFLGVTPMICFDFGEKSEKEKTRKSRQTWAPTPQRREPTLQRSPTP